MLSGKISAGKGVRSVEVTVNGETVFQETAKAEPRRTVVLNASLPLRDGKNIILVTATDPAGTTSQEARTVVYVAPLHLQMPPPGQPLRVGRAARRAGRTDAACRIRQGCSTCRSTAA